MKRIHHDLDDEFPYIKEEVPNTIVMLVLVKNEEFKICMKRSITMNLQKPLA